MTRGTCVEIDWTILAAAIGWLITLWSCASLDNAGLVQEAATLFLDPHSTLTRLDATTRTLHSRPIDAWAPPGSTGERALSRYIYQCTAPPIECWPRTFCRS